MNPIIIEMALAEKYLRMFDNNELTERKDLLKALSLKWFRLNALYKIKNKDAKVVRFRANRAQIDFYKNRHGRDIILKARQLGFTTFKMIDSLDSCLFEDNYSAGCIAHIEKAAKSIFRSKVKFAYEHISGAWLRAFEMIGLRFPTPKNDKDNAYVFTNGSSIQVSTSYRGDTLQDLHVSEFGKVCAAFPDRAEEIVTGAFEAVPLDGNLTIESTAEGREGYFFEYCETAQQYIEMKKTLTKMDFGFHFYPWFDDPEYTLDDPDAVIYPWQAEYFKKLEAETGITLTDGQKAWYVKKEQVQKDKIKREYPSTPKEAFEQSIEGAYYHKEMTFIRSNKQLSKNVRYNPSLPVITAWDLGMNDATAIWLCQIAGRQVHVIGYIENSGEGIKFYADELQKLGYTYSHHFGPHDLSVRELGAEGKTRQEDFAKYGIKFEVVPRVSNQMEGINAVRSFLPICWFNEEDCAQGVKCLDSYRKDWDSRLGTYKDKPRHDWASHGAKAFETLARSDLFTITSPFSQPVIAAGSGGSGWRGHT